MSETVTAIITILAIIYGLLMFFVPVFIYQIRDHVKMTNRLLKEQNELIRHIGARQ